MKQDKTKAKQGHASWPAYAFIVGPDGKRHRRREWYRTRTEAIDRTPVLKAELRTEVFGTKKPECPTLAAFIPAFWEEYADKKPSTKVVRQSALTRYLLPLFGGLLLDRFTAEEYRTLKQHLIKSGVTEPNSINSVMCSLGAVLRVAKDKGHAPNTPALKPLLLRRKPSAAIVKISGEELNAIRGAAQEEAFSAMLLTAYDTGLRRCELMALRRESVDLDNALLTVRLSVFRGQLDTPKSGKDREIPLTPRVVAALRALPKSKNGFVFTRPDGEPYTESGVRSRLRSACKVAGVRQLRWHLTRHTFATNLDKAGASPRTIQKLAGHASLSTTEGYLHSHLDELRAAIAKLNPIAPEGAPANSDTPESLTVKGQLARARKCRT